MKLRFYFDYSDYRSYLMMHAIRGLDSLPVSMQWFALDAYSLRALCGTDGRTPSPAEREFAKREAMRYCEREGIEFVWQHDPLHLGSPLRIGIWLMAHRDSQFESFSKIVLETIWGRGKNIDQNVLREAVASLGLDFDEILRSSSENDFFQMQDAMLHEAIADGVFDIPAVLIGENLVCHFDQAREIRRLAILECLQSIPQNIVYNAFAESLMQLPDSACERTLIGMARKMNARQSTMLVVDPGISLQRSLDIPNAQWQLPRTQVTAPIPCHVCNPASESIQDAFQDAVENAFNLYYAPNLRWSGARDIRSGLRNGPLVFCAPVLCGEKRAILLVTIDDKGKIHVAHSLLDAADIGTTALGPWKIAAISPNAHGDLNIARHAAFLGSHILCRIGDADSAPVSEAAGSLARAWVLEFSPQGIALVDAQAHRTRLAAGATVMLQPDCLLQAQPWTPAAPRTLLLCEHAFAIGEIANGADLEFSARGANLLATASGQGSEISPSRTFEKFRIRNANIVIVPLAAELIFRTEAISQRFVQMLNRAPRDGMPIFVNYWTELEFEMLESMRPVLAATTQMFQIPAVLVVGSQAVEVWIPSTSGPAWRIEKDDDRYTLDLASAPSCALCFERLLASLNTTEDTFIERLRNIEKSAHSA